MLPAESFGLTGLIAGLALVSWGLRPRPAPRRSPETWNAPLHPPAESPTQEPEVAPAAPATVPTPSAPTAPRATPRPRPRPITWRTFALAPAEFDDALRRGDRLLVQRELSRAAVWYGKAYRLACEDRACGRYFFTEAILRLNTLVGLCLTPPDGFHPAAEDERWSALRLTAGSGFLGTYQPAIVRLGSMLYRRHRNRETLGPEGRAAWDVLLTCRNLPDQALEFLDGQLLDEGLWTLRSQLATHPSAGKALWLSMLKCGRTPDLVHTIWEIAGAAEDEEVKAALTAG